MVIKCPAGLLIAGDYPGILSTGLIVTYSSFRAVTFCAFARARARARARNWCPVSVIYAVSFKEPRNLRLR